MHPTSCVAAVSRIRIAAGNRATIAAQTSRRGEFYSDSPATRGAIFSNVAQSDSSVSLLCLTKSDRQVQYLYFLSCQKSFNSII